MTRLKTMLGRLTGLIAPLLALSSTPSQAATAQTLAHSLDDSRLNAEFRRALGETPSSLASDSILKSAGLAAGFETNPGLASPAGSAQKKHRRASSMDATKRHQTRHRHHQQRHRRHKR